VTFIFHAAIGHFLRLTTIVPLYFVVVSTYWVFLQGLLQALLQEQGRYGRISAVYIGEGTFRGIVGVSVIVAGLGIDVTLAIYMLSAILATFFLPRPRALWTGERAPRRVLAPLYRDIVPLLFSNIGFSLLTTLDVVLCRRYLSPVVADQYTAIAQMAKFFLAATGSIAMIAFAEVVKAAHHGEPNARPLGISLALIAGLGVPFVLFCLLFGPFVTAFAFGGAFRESGHALWITATSAFSISLLTLETAYFNARRWLGYLPVFLLGTVAAIAALPLAHHSLRGYAGTYAIATTTLALLFLLPVFLGLTGRIALGGAQGMPPALPTQPDPLAIVRE
jgi:O-antigen/teichoic acid export membrane protein